jgi:hypothetical protein
MLLIKKVMSVVDLWVLISHKIVEDSFTSKMWQKSNWTSSPLWVHNAPKTVPDTVLATIGVLLEDVRAQPPGQTHSTKALN